MPPEIDRPILLKMKMVGKEAKANVKEATEEGCGGDAGMDA